VSGYLERSNNFRDAVHNSLLPNTNFVLDLNVEFDSSLQVQHLKIIAKVVCGLPK